MKFVKEFVVPALVLTIICVVVSAALVFTYDTTKPIIEMAQQREADAARAVVLPGADQFNKLDVAEKDGFTEAYEAANGAGYVITTYAVGYGGANAPLTIMTGIKADGTVAGVTVLSSNETQGIGSQVNEDKYTRQYIGKDYNLEGVEAISGATISSGAFSKAVKIAFEVYGEVAGVEMAEPVPPEQQIFPNATDFVEFELEGAKKAYMAAGEGIVVVMESKGYSEAPTPMDVYVGFGTDLKIAGVALGENSETQGIGSQVGEEAYTSQYVGKENTDGIQAISGATESSTGFKKAVNAALELLPAIEAKMPEVAVAKYAAVLPGVVAVTPIENENAVEAVKADGVGIVVVAQHVGYNEQSPVQVMVGISEEGKITGIKVVSCNETEGIGSKVTEESYLNGWVGKASGESVSAISGATMSSNAVKRCVEKAFMVFDASKGA